MKNKWQLKENSIEEMNNVMKTEDTAEDYINN